MKAGQIIGAALGGAAGYAAFRIINPNWELAGKTLNTLKILNPGQKVSQDDWNKYTPAAYVVVGAVAGYFVSK